MGGGSKRVTVGYKYYLGVHMVLGKGPFDTITEIYADKRLAWNGVIGSGQISINKPELFGGQEREGGIIGNVDIAMGLDNQQPNDYLVSKMSPRAPAFTGVVSAILRQVYLGVNPYLKNWSFMASRIYLRQNGIEQWYPEKAEISVGDESTPYQFQLLDRKLTWEYKVVNRLDTTDYSNGFTPDGVGPAPFYNKNPHPYLSDYWQQGMTSGTVVGADNDVWVQKDIFVPVAGDYNVNMGHDNEATVYLDGEFIGKGDAPFPTFETTFPLALPAGYHKLVIRNHETNVPSEENYFFLDFTVDYVGTYQNNDMNPAHIIYECLTDPDWGMGYPEADIDDANFRAVADTLFNEGFGLSLIWDGQMAIEEFITEILRHIDASLFIDRTSGKFKIKLIRQDYSIGTLPVFDETNIVSVQNIRRRTFEEMVNSVTVKYWDRTTRDTGTYEEKEPGLERMQGSVVPTTVTYTGITTKRNAVRAARRDLRALSAAILTGKITTTRDASELNIGDPIVFEWPSLGIEPTVVRVEDISFGNGLSNKVTLSISEDVFFVGNTIQEEEDTDLEEGWVNPSQVPTHIQYPFIDELPYYELVKAVGQNQADTILSNEPDAGFWHAAGEIPAEGAIGYRTLSDLGFGYEQEAVGDFIPVLFIESYIYPATSVVTYDTEFDDDLIAVGDYGSLNDELVAVDAIDTTTKTITLKRGILDTYPKEHGFNASLKIWKDRTDYIETQFVSSESVNVKLIPFSGAGSPSEDTALVSNLIFGSRAIRPFGIGKFTINGNYLPNNATGDLSLNWVDRNRLLQTTPDLIGFADDNVTPEASVSTVMKIYGENDELGRTVVNPSLPYVYQNTTEKNDFEYPGLGSASGEDPFYDDVVALFRCEGHEGSTILQNDIVGNPWFSDGAYLDSTQKKAGRYSIYCGGSRHLRSEVSTKYDIPDGVDFTWECYFYLPASTANIEVLMARQGDSDPGLALQLRKDASDKLQAVIRTASSSVVDTITGSTTILPGLWHHAALTRSGNTCYLLLDGAVEGSVVRSGNLTDPEAFMIIGALDYHKRGVSIDSYWTGWIDYPRVTIGTARYTAGYVSPDVPYKPIRESTLDYFSNYVSSSLTFDNVEDGIAYIRDTYLGDNSWSIQGNAVIDSAQAYAGANSLLLDGTGDGLKSLCLNLQITGDYTIEVAVHPAADGVAYTIASKRDLGANQNEWTLERNSLNQIYFAAWDSAGASKVIELTSTSTVLSGSFSSICVERLGTNWTLFIDGAVEATGTESGTPNADVYPVYIGLNGSSTGTAAFNGWIDQWRITHVGDRYAGSPYTPATFSFPQAFDIFQSLAGPHLPFDEEVNNDTVFHELDGKRMVAQYNAKYSTAVTPPHGVGALYLDGTDDGIYSEPVTKSEWDLFTTSWWMEMWVYPTAGGQYWLGGMTGESQFVGWNSTTGIHFLIATDSSNRIQFQLSSGGSSPRLFTSSLTLPANQWHHLVLGYDQSEWSSPNLKLPMVYIGVDGTLQYQRLTSTPSAPSGNQRLFFGNIGTTTSTTPFAGYIKDFRMQFGEVKAYETGSYEVPKHAAARRGDANISNTVSLLHFRGTNGSTVVKDVKGLPWTVNGTGQIVSSDSYVGTTCLNLPASSYITTPSRASFDLGSSDFTIEFWHKQVTTDKSNDRGLVCRDDVSGTRGFRIFIAASTGYVTAKVWISGTEYTLADTVDATTLTSTWRNIALTREGTNLRLFVNGSVVATASASLLDVASSSLPLVIGALWDTGAPIGTSYAISKIDEFRFTVGVARYGSGGFTTSDASLADRLDNTIQYGPVVGVSYRVARRLRFEIEKTRADGYANYQTFNFTLRRGGYGVNYGYLYGKF